MKLLTGRIRVIDGVVLAAAALLVLKAISYLATPSSPELGPDGLPTFARVLAHARSNYRPADPETTGSVPDKKDAKPGTMTSAAAAAAASGPSTQPTGKAVEDAEPKGSPSERAIRERLGERREELQRRQRDLEAREKLIEEAERRNDGRTEEARLAEEKAAQGANPAAKEAGALKGLVIMYETMKPKDAARVFDRLPEDVLVPVVRLIAPRKMAEIMAAMNSEAAQKLTVALARPPVVASAEPSVATLPPGELPAIDAGPKPVSPRRN